MAELSIFPLIGKVLQVVTELTIELSSVPAQLRDLKNTLETLRFVLDSNAGGGSDLRKQLSRPLGDIYDTLERLDEALRRMRPDIKWLGPNNTARVYWWFQKDEIKALLGSLEQRKSTLLIHLSVMNARKRRNLSDFFRSRKSLNSMEMPAKPEKTAPEKARLPEKPVFPVKAKPPERAKAPETAKASKKERIAEKAKIQEDSRAAKKPAKSSAKLKAPTKPPSPAKVVSPAGQSSSRAETREDAQAVTMKAVKTAAPVNYSGIFLYKKLGER